MNVTVLTRAKKPDLILTGATLFLDTIRTGFPTATIHILDNASIPEAQPPLIEGATRINATYTHLEREIPHWMYLQSVVYSNIQGPVVIVDPDCVFWKNCETIDIGDKLIGGRYSPDFYNDFAGARDMERLHTSFLFIPDLQKLQRRIAALPNNHVYFNPFMPFMFKREEKWWRQETLGNLYAAIKEECFHFTEKEMDLYDHLMSGSEVNIVARCLAAQDMSMLLQAHIDARTNPLSLKGLWKKQEEFYKRKSISPDAKESL